VQQLAAPGVNGETHMPSPSLDGLTMHVVETADAGDVNQDTQLLFSEEDGLVSASYSGGRIRAGCLVGIRVGEVLTFRYAQTDTDGRIDGGVSNCEIARTPDGLVRVTEHFKWESREGAGTNVFEEIRLNRGVSA
jgi:hypothetical protein